MVVGSPIELPKEEEPSKEQVQQYLDCFITEMKALFEKHKASAGYPELQLRVI
jgi:2-acylglycerol O-acyltransferase 2